MTITHDSEPTLSGPMSREEFLQNLQAKMDAEMRFIERNKSKNPVHPYSYIGEGYIIMQLTDAGLALYDSVRNPDAYMRATDDWGYVVGRHTKTGEYFMADAPWGEVRGTLDGISQLMQGL